MSNFGERVKAARMVLGISQYELAERTGLSKQSISKIETNPTVKNSYHLAELAEALGVTPDYLKTGKESPKKVFVRIKISEWDNIGNIVEQGNFFFKNDYIYLRVNDDSMFGRHDKRVFPEGVILIIDPTVEIKNKDFVVASHKNTKKTFFRQYIDDGIEISLRPINAQYRVYSAKDFDILGTVIASLDMDL